MKPYKLNDTYIMEEDMMRIYEHYKLQRTIEYIMETYQVSYNYAESVAAEVERLRGKTDDSFEEDTVRSILDEQYSATRSSLKGGITQVGNLFIESYGDYGFGVIFLDELTEDVVFEVMSVDIDYCSRDELFQPLAEKELTQEQIELLDEFYKKLRNVVKKG